ncbi:MAG: CAP domain-containing protein [Ruminococcaceae bacterium]|nr:CAP domain-containing protein [Oscillospiraceae bacterium]
MGYNVSRTVIGAVPCIPPGGKNLRSFRGRNEVDTMKKKAAVCAAVAAALLFSVLMVSCDQETGGQLTDFSSKSESGTVSSKPKPRPFESSVAPEGDNGSSGSAQTSSKGTVSVDLTGAPEEVAKLVEQLNELRAEKGLVPLTYDAGLTKAADYYCKEFAGALTSSEDASNYISKRPNGSAIRSVLADSGYEKPSTSCTHWLGYSFSSAFSAKKWINNFADSEGSNAYTERYTKIGASISSAETSFGSTVYMIMLFYAA